ncbi:MAG: undecaprenyl-diphosphatase UppP [Patescibacteria group bacterium]
MDLLYYSKAAILGFVQGFSEFLPISSTAHLLLSVELLRIDLNDFIKSFVIIIQLGSILAVLVLYWNKIISNISIYFKKLLVAFIPTAILGLIFYKVVKNVFQESFLIISLALFLGGILILILEKRHKREVDTNLNSEWINEISYKKCFYIGIFQALAMIPGVSRSAATIFGGLSLGVSRKSIVEFSFLLAIPTMAAASGLDLIKSSFSFNQKELIFLTIGFVLSFFVAIIFIKFLINYIKKNDFKIFAWYRIFLAIAILIFFYL